MNKTLLVSGLWWDQPYHPYHLHDSQAKFERYLNSITHLNTMGLPIKLYVGSNVYDRVVQHCTEKDLLGQRQSLENVEVIKRDLNELEHCQKSLLIKEKYPHKFKFYYELGINKVSLVEENTINPCVHTSDAEYVYWIDSGLSHWGLYPNKYNSRHKEMTGFSTHPQNYTFDGIFNDKTFDKINSWLGDKLLDIRTSLLYYIERDINKVTEHDFTYHTMAIGGLFGGHKSKVPLLCSEFNKNSQKCLDKDFLLDHEALLSPIE